MDRDLLVFSSQLCLPAMPTDEYASAGGGSLKLKGVNSSSKIAKKKKKRPKSDENTPSSNPEALRQTSRQEDGDPAEEASRAENDKKVERESDAQPGMENEVLAPGRGKTEAELRHGERRRRRVWLEIHYLYSD